LAYLGQREILGCECRLESGLEEKEDGKKRSLNDSSWKKHRAT
jgi:hypothetical protein